VRATRTHPVVSYGELSSDSEVEEELEDPQTDSDASPIAPRRRVPSRAQKTSSTKARIPLRKRHRSAKIDSDDDEHGRRAKRRKQPITQKKRKRTIIVHVLGVNHSQFHVVLHPVLLSVLVFKAFC
jgi:uncharacterized protein with WD repeat